LEHESYKEKKRFSKPIFNNLSLPDQSGLTGATNEENSIAISDQQFNLPEEIQGKLLTG